MTAINIKWLLFEPLAIMNEPKVEQLNEAIQATIMDFDENKTIEMYKESKIV
jgi:hypothetical protein